MIFDDDLKSEESGWTEPSEDSLEDTLAKIASGEYFKDELEETSKGEASALSDLLDAEISDAGSEMDLIDETLFSDEEPVEENPEEKAEAPKTPSPKPKAKEGPEPAWYVVHTFSGYENKVQEGLERTIEHRGMSDKVMEVKIPMREVVEEKNGKKVTVQKKLFPGYVIVRMIMDDDAWYLVRNQRGVTGFVGPNGQKPIPLTKQELDNMGVVKLEKEEPLFSEGDHIEVIEGPLKGEVTMIEEVLEETQEVRIRTSILGNNTSTLIGFDKIHKIEV